MQMVVHGECIDLGTADGFYAVEANEITGLIIASFKRWAPISSTLAGMLISVSFCIKLNTLSSILATVCDLPDCGNLPLSTVNASS